MSRRKRWQPPHPDPAKESPPSTRAANDAIFDATFTKIVTGAHHATCAWSGCPKPVSLSLRIPICDAHAEIVCREVAYTRNLRTRAKAEREADHQQALAENTEKINNGERPGPGPIPGWVYYIRVDDTIKIGYARSVRSRMRSYPPTAALLAVEPGTKKLEKERHDRFNAYLAHGREWFRDVPELRTWIATLIQEYGKPTEHEYTYRTPQSGRQVTTPRYWTGHKRTAA